MAQPLFDKTYIGQLNFSNQEAWADLGVITGAIQIMFGYATYSCDGKTIIVELRTNKLGFSDGSVANTDMHDRVSLRDGDSKDRDYYRNAQTSRKSVVSTGVEHCWLRFKSKSNNNADAYWWIDYTEI